METMLFGMLKYIQPFPYQTTFSNSAPKKKNKVYMYTFPDANLICASGKACVTYIGTPAFPGVHIGLHFRKSIHVRGNNARWEEVVQCA